MAFNIASTNEEVVDVTATPMTGGPNPKPAQVDGPLRVTVQSGDATIEPQDPATPLVVTFRSGDAPGQSTFLLEADADLGAGVTLVQETVTYDVSGAQATSFGLTASVPRPKV